jgi:hypothetical protein
VDTVVVGPMGRLAAVATADLRLVAAILRVVAAIHPAAVAIHPAARRPVAMVRRVTALPVAKLPVTRREADQGLVMGRGNLVTVVAIHLPVVRPRRRARRCFGRASAAAFFCCSG